MYPTFHQREQRYVIVDVFWKKVLSFDNRDFDTQTKMNF